jgi:hypothetical protein
LHEEAQEGETSMTIRTPILLTIPTLSTPRVWNKHHRNAPADAIYIGRGSPWGNPFVIGKDGTREEVIRKYEEDVMRSPATQQLIREHLRGKHLVCFCSPKPCHGDVLLRIANEVSHEHRTHEPPA